jgi:hypothetical protein
MERNTFRLIPQKDRHISVDMTTANGQHRLFPDFRDEADANAWIVQMQRLLHATQPRLPGAKHRV